MRRTLLLLSLLLGCARAEGSPASAPDRSVLTVLAVDDTAKIYASWTAANRASGYLLAVTVSATNGTWTGLPTALAVTGTATVVTAASTGADSANFVVCIRSTSGASVSPQATCSTARQWKRVLRPPSSVQIDSAVSLASVSSVTVSPSTLVITVE